MRILVVGATGFIGSHLVEHLVQAGHEVEGWGRRPSSGLPLHRYRSLDLTRPDAFDGLQGPWDAAYLLSAHAVPGLPWTSEMVLENLRMAGHLLEFLQSAAPRCRTILASSALVYGTGGSDFPEDRPSSPGSLYALSKVLAETWAAFSARTMDLHIARIFNQVGAGMPGGLLATDALARLRDPSETLVFQGSDSIRDYLDIRDGAEALAQLLKAPGPSGSVWNICSGEGHSVSQLAALLMEATGIRKPIAFLRQGSDRLVGDPRKLTEATGWRPRHSLGEALEQLARDPR